MQAPDINTNSNSGISESETNKDNDLGKSPKKAVITPLPSSSKTTYDVQNVTKLTTLQEPTNDELIREINDLMQHTVEGIEPQVEQHRIGESQNAEDFGDSVSSSINSCAATTPSSFSVLSSYRISYPDQQAYSQKTATEQLQYSSGTYIFNFFLL